MGVLGSSPKQGVFLGSHPVSWNIIPHTLHIPVPTNLLIYTYPRTHAPPNDTTDSHQSRGAGICSHRKHLAGRGDLSRLQTYVHARPPLSTLTGNDFVVYQQNLDLALTSAAHNGRVDCVSLLLDQGAHISATAASVAAMSGSNALAIYKAFVEHGWDVNETSLKSHSGSTQPLTGIPFSGLVIPSYYCRVRGELTPRCSQVVHDEAMTLVPRPGTDPTMPTDPSRSPLTTAATSGNQAVVELLLSRGVKLEESNALHTAVFCKTRCP